MIENVEFSDATGADMSEIDRVAEIRVIYTNKNSGRLVNVIICIIKILSSVFMLLKRVNI